MLIAGFYSGPLYYYGGRYYERDPTLDTCCYAVASILSQSEKVTKYYYYYYYYEANSTMAAIPHMVCDPRVQHECRYQRSG